MRLAYSDQEYSGCYSHVVEVNHPRTGRVLGYRIVRELTEQGTYLTKEEAVSAMFEAPSVFLNLR